jgi:hypothetical protein
VARARASLVRRVTRQERGQLDVLLRGELVHQLERLEDESDLVAAQVREGAFGELVDALPRDRQLTGARAAVRFLEPLWRGAAYTLAAVAVITGRRSRLRRRCRDSRERVS